MANTWGELSWNTGLWGEQSNAIATLTGFGLTTTQGQANYTPVDGWGRNTWGALGWGVNYADITTLLTGSQLNLSEADVIATGEINEGWGRLTWGENAWGGTGDVIVLGNQINLSTGTVTFKIDSLPSVTGLQLNTSINDVYAFGLALVFPTGQQLNLSEGEVDPAPDALVTGQQLGIYSPGDVSISAEINSGWGRRGWGIFDWGGEGLSVTVAITGQQLNISQGDESSSANADVQVASTYQAGWGVVAWGSQKWGQGELDIAMTISEGEVDPSPDATVTGIGITISLAVGTVVIGTANVTVSGEQLNLTLNSVEAVPNTLVSVTGIGLNIGVGTVFAGATAVIPVTGNGLTITLNSINNQIWTEINTGTDATWIEIDTAA